MFRPATLKIHTGGHTTQPRARSADRTVRFVGPEAFAELCHGPSLPVELNRDVDLLFVQSLSAHGDACPVGVSGHGQAMDPEAIRELVDGGAFLVAANELINFIIP